MLKATFFLLTVCISCYVCWLRIEAVKSQLVSAEWTHRSIHNVTSTKHNTRRLKKNNRRNITKFKRDSNLLNDLHTTITDKWTTRLSDVLHVIFALISDINLILFIIGIIADVAVFYWFVGFSRADSHW